MKYAWYVEVHYWQDGKPGTWVGKLETSGPFETREAAERYATAAVAGAAGAIAKTVIEQQIEQQLEE